MDDVNFQNFSLFLYFSSFPANENMNLNAELLLNPTKVKSLVEFWLEEDIPGFDVGAAVVGNKISTGSLP